MIADAIIRAYQEKHQRNWDKLYFAVDLHGTIIERYTGNEIKVYPNAEGVLRSLSFRPDVTLILFTSTYQENLKEFFKWCSDQNIVFKYLNENPECPNNKTGDFSKKFYFNVLIDDRAGFNPDTDWAEVSHGLNLADVMTNCPKIGSCPRGLSHSAVYNLCEICKNNAYLFGDVPQ